MAEIEKKDIENEIQQRRTPARQPDDTAEPKKKAKWLKPVLWVLGLFISCAVLYAYLELKPVVITPAPVDIESVDELVVMIGEPAAAADALELSVISDLELGMIDMPETKQFLGQTVTIKYDIRDFEYQVQYDSSDEDVLTIDEDNNFVPVAIGYSTVTITSGNVAKQVKVAVKQYIKPTEMPEKAEVVKDRSVSVGPELGEFEVLKTTFGMVNPDIASVSEEGVITGITKGTTTLNTTLSDGSIAKTEIRVYQPVLGLNVVDKSVYKGNTVSASVSYTPSDADYGRGLTYVSDNEGVATINSSGVITGKAEGTATITVTSEEGIQATFTVTVKRPSTNPRDYSTSDPAVAAALALVGTKQKCTSVAEAAANARGKTGWTEWDEQMDGFIRHWKRLTCENFLSIGTQIPYSQIQPGDILYYRNGGRGESHVAVYIGNGMAVHGNWTTDGETCIRSATYTTVTTVIHI